MGLSHALPLFESRDEYSKIARILKRSHVFQFIPLSCEIVQCSPEREERGVRCGVT